MRVCVCVRERERQLDVCRLTIATLHALYLFIAEMSYYRIIKWSVLWLLDLQVVVRSGNLGLAFAAGLLLSFSGVSWATFGWYLTVISFFHWSEYFFTATTNPRSLTLESFLLDHSREYELAVVASCTEYFLEWFIYPGMSFFCTYLCLVYLPFIYFRLNIIIYWKYLYSWTLFLFYYFSLLIHTHWFWHTSENMKKDLHIIWHVTLLLIHIWVNIKVIKGLAAL